MLRGCFILYLNTSFASKYFLMIHFIEQLLNQNFNSPTNLVADGPDLEDDDAKDAVVNKSEAVSDEEDVEEVQRRREEKGKGIADPENEEIQLKARRSDAGTHDLIITAGKKDTVRQLTRKFSQSGGLQPPKRIQLYYMGRICKSFFRLLSTY